MRRTAAIAWALTMHFAFPALAECADGMHTRIIPLPIIATEPNEGNTYGFMPVFIRVCDATQRTEAIIAPSVSWNETIQLTGTLRWFMYPTDDESLTVIASASTRINSNARVTWQDLPLSTGAFTREAEVRWERSVFWRFFGIGPDTPSSNQSSYTRVLGHAYSRLGYNFAEHWSLGGTLAFHIDRVQDIGVSGLPLARQLFPNTPGMAGSSTLTELADVRFDNRKIHEYSESGIYFDAAAGPVEGITGSPAFGRGFIDFRALLPELSWLSAAFRANASFTSTSQAPFYEQSALGGEYLMRGFQEDRFIDENAWTAEAEERIRLFQLHIFGVTADARIDPFVAVGQVFGGFDQLVSNPKISGGVGFRAFVHPNVLGRVDVATGGEGLNVYVEIGYPY